MISANYVMVYYTCVPVLDVPSDLQVPECVGFSSPPVYTKAVPV